MMTFLVILLIHQRKVLKYVGNILNDDDFFGDIVDTPKEGIEICWKYIKRW